MPKKEVPIDHLQNYLPPGAPDAVTGYLHQYKVHLTITRQRKSILGDYRHPTHHSHHRISVNGDLNPFSFLITLLHELGHLLTFEQHGNRVPAHGTEWKKIYAELLKQFLQHKTFPADIERELLRSLKNPGAGPDTYRGSEDGLLRILRKYDATESHNRLVEEIPPGALFRISDGRIFKRGEKLRKRFKCVEVKTGKVYLFSPVYEVQLV